MNISDYRTVDVAVVGAGTAARGAFAEARAYTDRCVLIDGGARFLGPRHLYANDRVIEAGAIVVAADIGTRVPEDWERFADGTLSVADLDEARDLPGTVAVVGLDPCGLALAQRLAGRGVEVIGFECVGRLSCADDPGAGCWDLRRVARPFRIVLGHDIGVQRYGRRFRVRAGGGSAVVDKLLFASARAPEWAGMAWHRIGGRRTGTGSETPGFDPQTLRIPGSCVFVAGGSDEGRVAGFNAVRAAGVRGAGGSGVARATARGRITVGAHWDELDPGSTVYAQAGSVEQGQMTLVADTRTDVILGGTLAGPGCEPLAQLLGGFVQQQLTVRQALFTPCCQPALDAALRAALLALQTALDATPVVPCAVGARREVPRRTANRCSRVGGAVGSPGI